MEQAIIDAYGEEILQEFMERYGIEASQIELLDGFESFVYHVVQEGRECALRISHTGLRRSLEEIRGEAEFIHYLAQNGVSCARPLMSPQGNLVERSAEGDHDFVATAFEWAEGDTPGHTDRTPEFMRQFGAIMGRMHRLTKDYILPEGCHRPDGLDDLMGYMAGFKRTEEPVIIDRYRGYLDAVRGLPWDRDGYGLIHGDMHMENIHVDDAGRIKVFDFDDSSYFYFVADIAVALFHLTPHRCTPEQTRRMAEVYTWMMEGYRSENQLSSQWLASIPLFMRLRQIDLYCILKQDWEYVKDDEWCISYMEGRRERVLSDAPVLDIDFTV